MHWHDVERLDSAIGYIVLIDSAERYRQNVPSGARDGLVQVSDRTRAFQVCSRIQRLRLLPGKPLSRSVGARSIAALGGQAGAFPVVVRSDLPPITRKLNAHVLDVRRGLTGNNEPSNDDVVAAVITISSLLLSAVAELENELIIARGHRDR